MHLRTYLYRKFLLTLTGFVNVCMLLFVSDNVLIRYIDKENVTIVVITGTAFVRVILQKLVRCALFLKPFLSHVKPERILCFRWNTTAFYCVYISFHNSISKTLHLVCSTMRLWEVRSVRVCVSTAMLAGCCVFHPLFLTYVTLQVCSLSDPAVSCSEKSSVHQINHSSVQS